MRCDFLLAYLPLAIACAACDTRHDASAPSTQGSAVASAEPPAVASPASSSSSSSSPASSSPPSPATAGTLRLGEPVTEKLIALTDIAKNPHAYENKVVATSGIVFAVCQSMGCWMEIKDDAGAAHVKLAGHHFFVPKTSAGHRARVQARVLKTDANDECAQEAAEQTGKPVAKLELLATGVELD